MGVAQMKSRVCFFRGAYTRDAEGFTRQRLIPVLSVRAELEFSKPTEFWENLMRRTGAELRVRIRHTPLVSQDMCFKVKGRIYAICAVVERGALYIDVYGKCVEPEGGAHGTSKR